MAVAMVMVPSNEIKIGRHGNYRHYFPGSKAQNFLVSQHAVIGK
jgi:hypothetical protein